MTPLLQLMLRTDRSLDRRTNGTSGRVVKQLRSHKLQ